MSILNLVLDIWKFLCYNDFAVVVNLLCMADSISLVFLQVTDNSENRSKYSIFHIVYNKAIRVKTDTFWSQTAKGCVQSQGLQDSLLRALPLSVLRWCWSRSKRLTSHIDYQRIA